MLLRERFGLSAADVYHGLPGWEVDLLLSAVRQDEPGDDSAGQPAPRGGTPDPWGSPPDLPI